MSSVSTRSPLNAVIEHSTNTKSIRIWYERNVSAIHVSNIHFSFMPSWTQCLKYINPINWIHASSIYRPQRCRLFNIFNCLCCYFCLSDTVLHTPYTHTAQPEPDSHTHFRQHCNFSFVASHTTYISFFFNKIKRREKEVGAHSLSPELQ